MADTPKVRFESKMLIDGKLVDAAVSGDVRDPYAELAAHSGVMGVVHPLANYQAAERGLHDVRVLLWAH